MKLVPFVMALALVSCASNHNKPTETEEEIASNAISDIHSPNNKVSGKVQIETMEDHLKFTVNVKGLKPNTTHGFHIHEKGLCEGPDYKSAGGHLNPFKQPHGAPKDEKKHLGDLGNLIANNKGVAEKVITIPKEGHENAMELIMGKAFVIHGKADDLKSQPSGDAGSRIACGLIKPAG